MSAPPEHAAGAAGAVTPDSATGLPPGASAVDCAAEPIHVPGSIQPHGALLVVDPETLRVVQAAVGPGGVAAVAGDPLGQRLVDVLPTSAAPLIRDLPARLPETGVTHLGMTRTGDAVHHLLGHRSDGALVIELERALVGEPGSFDEVYPHVRELIDEIHRVGDIAALSALAARAVRRITGLDRVLIYRFDADWNGEVMAEDRNERLPSYLGLRFPAADIPAQARELYRLNRLRLIAAASYAPTPIVPAENPLTGRPIDLAFSVLRSVSPVHLEYMRNMGTGASMSISLMRGDRLWGLIACHNREPVSVPYHVRTACDFIGQVLSLQLAATEASATADRRNKLRAVHNRLLTRMAAAEHHVDGLVESEEDLLALAGASGAAVVAGGTVLRLGATPSERDVLRIVAWLADRERLDVTATDSLADTMPGGEALKDTASGVLAISISQIHDSFVLWFRPEVLRTVTWGGDPRRHAEPSADGQRLHPRRSFAAWQETVRLRAPPWQPAEIDAVVELRTAIIDIVLRKAEETAALSDRLTAINKELEAFSYSVSHDLRAPFRHIVGYAQLLKKFEGDKLSERGNRYIDTIVESAISAGELVDDLLGFSQMGRAALTPVTIDMNALVADLRRRTEADTHGRRVEWHVAPLPEARADPMMIRLAMQNLIENAVKFSRDRDPAVIEIAATETPDETIYRVRDNGAGFDMAYVGKLFGVFQRLHRAEEFEGTGIGLANVKRIAERHGGRVWAEGRVDGGATLFFALPKR
ncbi:Phytochrome-like protein cph1 [Rhodoplanes serenus]|uniref:histidine kinase n=1 Tax=Rhodoplanes serenus TaxID=200615 RepID=A0A447CNU2_9BRAD|nr:ATP-binding protein [Rhodoplanes serenus]VCU06808.1 Phytochrome-like protein cph1 [Rhodoplanes serenus]